MGLRLMYGQLAVTLRAIWSARQKAIQEGVFQSPEATQNFITIFIRELEILRENLQKCTRAAPSTSAARLYHARPRAPPPGYAKFHVDGGVSRTSRSGSAVAVCHDGTGNCLGSSAPVIEGIIDPAALEAIASREALALADDLLLLLQNFIISSDSKQVVGDSASGNQGRYGPIITEINLGAATFNYNFIFDF